MSGPGLHCSLRCRTWRALIAMLQVYTHCLCGTVWYTTSVCVCVCINRPSPTDQRTSRAALWLLRSFLSPIFLLCSCFAVLNVRARARSRARVCVRFKDPKHGFMGIASTSVETKSVSIYPCILSDMVRTRLVSFGWSVCTLFPSLGCESRGPFSVTSTRPPCQGVRAAATIGIFRMGCLEWRRPLLPAKSLGQCAPAYPQRGCTLL